MKPEDKAPSFEEDMKEAQRLENLIRAENTTTRAAAWAALNILLSVAADSDEPSEWSGDVISESGEQWLWKVVVTRSRVETPEA